jgi:hydrogenase expression/formation protein HypE
MRSEPFGEESAIIGEVADTPANRVLMKTEFGSTRVVDMLMGEMLPRIC